jgi:3-hydroxybutyryl-CoA dehydratase
VSWSNREIKKLIVGDSYSKEFVITSKIYQGFLNTFKDYNPLHTDLEFANKKGFKDVVMHGNILNGFLSFFIGECLPIKDVILIKQEINYRNPFFINDSLDLSVVIKEYFESVGLVTFKYNFRNQDQLKIANGMIQIKLIL